MEHLVLYRHAEMLGGLTNELCSSWRVEDEPDLTSHMTTIWLRIYAVAFKEDWLSFQS